MKLILESHRKKIPALRSTNSQSDEQRMVYVKLFARNLTWFILEMDRLGDEVYCYLRNDADTSLSEFGYSSIRELERTGLPMSITVQGRVIRKVCKIERDLHFKPMTLAALKAVNYHA